MEYRERSCPHCARPVRAGIIYCTMCGARLDGEPATAHASSDYVPLRDVPAPRRTRKRRGRNHAWQFWRPRHFSLHR